MFTWLVDKIISLFSLGVQFLSWILSFLFNHLWALFVGIWTIIFSVFNAILDTLKGWLFSIVPPLENLGDLNFGGALSDFIDRAILANFGDDFVSSVGKDIFYCFSLGDFFVALSSIFIPTVIAVFVYRLVKSYIPTISGA